MTDYAPRSSRGAIVSLTAGTLGLAYSAFIVVLFWVSLSAFDSRTLTLAVPALLAGTAAIGLGCVSLRKHGWRLDRSAAKLAVIGLLSGCSSLLLPLLPKLVFTADSIANPPNYEVVVELQGDPAEDAAPGILNQTRQALASRLRTVPHAIEEGGPKRLLVRIRTAGSAAPSLAILSSLFARNLLAFHLVHPDNDTLVVRSSEPGFAPPRGFKPARNETELFFIDESPCMVGDVEEAYVVTDPSSGPVVAVQFGREGTERFAKITGDHVGHRLAIMLDERLYCAPAINEAIVEGSAVIAGDFTKDQADAVAIALRSGPLPVAVKIVGARFLK